MKQSKFEQFANLKSQGVKRLEIISKLGICESTYDNYKKRYEKEKTPKNLTPFNMELYFKMVMHKWYDMDKNMMAKKLCVSKTTLIKYEKKGILKNFARWLKLNGFDGSDAAQILKIKSMKDLRKYTEDFVSIQSVIKSVNTLCEYADFNFVEYLISDEIDTKLHQAVKLLAEVEELIKKSEYYNSNMVSEINERERIKKEISDKRFQEYTHHVANDAIERRKLGT